jgi:hypothetical protein
MPLNQIKNKQFTFIGSSNNYKRKLNFFKFIEVLGVDNTSLNNFTLSVIFLKKYFFYFYVLNFFHKHIQIRKANFFTISFKILYSHLDWYIKNLRSANSLSPNNLKRLICFDIEFVTEINFIDKQILMFNFFLCYFSKNFFLIW